MVTVNGKEVDAAGMTVRQCVERNGYCQDRIVVELNMQIVRKQEYDDVVLNDGDTVEVVSFVGGG